MGRENANFLKVEDAVGWYRRVDSTAIVNTDLDALAQYKKKKKYSQRVNNVLEEVEELKTEISDIKGLLHQLIDKAGK
tara:strand:+ start:392 stop:625 length:234 start_codon:yes stop_codon:yes gene_type:complete